MSKFVVEKDIEICVNNLIKLPVARLEQVLQLFFAFFLYRIACIARKKPVGAESDQLVNICSFAVRCDRRWSSTQ